MKRASKRFALVDSFKRECEISEKDLERQKRAFFKGGGAVDHVPEGVTAETIRRGKSGRGGKVQLRLAAFSEKVKRAQ
jgi:hypothetical protein